MEEIEQSMVAAVHRKSMAYVLQDVKCLKCSMVSESCTHLYVLSNLSGAGIAQLVVLGLAATVLRVRCSSGDIFR